MKSIMRVVLLLTLVLMVGCGKNGPISKLLGTDNKDLEGAKVIAYPSPFSDETTVRFSAEKNMVVNVKVYTVSGDLVRDLGELNYVVNDVVSGEKAWDGKNSDNQEVSSGVYIICVSSNGDSITFKVARMR